MHTCAVLVVFKCFNFFFVASSGGTAAPSFQKSVQPVGVYENSYGTSQVLMSCFWCYFREQGSCPSCYSLLSYIRHEQMFSFCCSTMGASFNFLILFLVNFQEALKGSSSENKSAANASKYGSGMEASDSLLPKPTSVNADLSGDWSKHDAPNGRSFYYNVATGATQWDKPSAMAAGVDANAVHQRQMQQVQGTATQDLNPELAALQHQQQKPALQSQQPAQQSVSPATVPAAQQIQPGNNGEHNSLMLLIVVSFTC